jgi:ABC-type multidrug transport system fused ATPase/permease subunit
VGVYVGVAVGCYLLVLLRCWLLAAFQKRSSRHFYRRLVGMLFGSAHRGGSAGGGGSSGLQRTGGGGEGLGSAPALRHAPPSATELLAALAAVDHKLLELWHFIAICGGRVVLSLGYIAVVVNFYGAFFVLALLSYAVLLEHYRRTSRILNELEAATGRALARHVRDTVSGLLCVRAYGREHAYQRTYTRLVENAAQAWSARCGVEAWAGTWFGLVGGVGVFVTALLVAIDPDAVDAGLSGMALLSAIMLLTTSSVAVRFASQLEANMRCVQTLHPEGTRRVWRDGDGGRGTGSIDAGAADCGGSSGFDSDGGSDGESSDGGSAGGWAAPRPQRQTAVRASWPERGQLSFVAVDASTAPGQPLLLHRAGFTVAAGSRCGLVGLPTDVDREADRYLLPRLLLGQRPAAGVVRMDGVDLATVDRRRLHQAVAYVPNDAVLFEGTLRFNLDPTGIASDTQLLASLERCYLRELVELLPGGLGAPVHAGGANFSTAERRMLGFCRAVVRQPKLVLVEDGSLAPDQTTERRFQTLLRTAFGTATVLVVTQRPLSIVDADQLLCFVDGRLVERGPPGALACDRHSHFGRLVRSSGGAAEPEGAAVLTEMLAGRLTLDAGYFRPTLCHRPGDGRRNLRPVAFASAGPGVPEVLSKSLWNPLQFVRFAFFTYAYPILKLGASRTLVFEDLYQLPAALRAPQLSAAIETSLAAVCASADSKQAARCDRAGVATVAAPRTGALLGWAFFRAFQGLVIRGGACMLLENVFAITQAVLLAQLLDGLEAGSDRAELYRCGGLLSATVFGRMVCMHLSAYYNWLTGLSMRSAAIGLLYSKVLSLRAESLTRMESGKIVTIISAGDEYYHILVDFLLFFARKLCQIAPSPLVRGLRCNLQSSPRSVASHK